MAYYTGTATSSADLITAITNAAVAKSWVLNTGTILTKGNVNAQLSEWSPRSGLAGVGLQVGTGQSAGSLTDASATIVGIRGDVQELYGYVPLAYPVTYHIFINTVPDEIVVAINYSSLYWKWIGFGQSTVLGVSGTGIYCWGSDMGYTATAAASSSGFQVTSGSGYAVNNPCFYHYGYHGPTSYIHLAFDSQDWWGNEQYNYHVRGYISVGTMLRQQPNTWNNEAVLIRTQIVALRASSFWSYVAELPHFRWLRNTYLEDGSVLSLGSDDWFVAPIVKKNLTTPDGTTANNNCHSGTTAFAVRKTP